MSALMWIWCLWKESPVSVGCPFTTGKSSRQEFIPYFFAFSFFCHFSSLTWRAIKTGFRALCVSFDVSALWFLNHTRADPTSEPRRLSVITICTRSCAVLCAGVNSTCSLTLTRRDLTVYLYNVCLLHRSFLTMPRNFGMMKESKRATRDPTSTSSSTVHISKFSFLICWFFSIIASNSEGSGRQTLT